MAQKFPLQLLLDLALRDADAQAREVKRAHGEWLRARGRRVHLLGIRDAQVNELAQQLRPGLPAHALQVRTRFMRLRQIDLDRAAVEIDITYKAWQALLARWMQAHDHVKALRVLEQRHLEARAIQERRTEQRQHDELAQNTRFWRADNEVST